jgi:predicted DNA-binding WGR domain protein
VVLYRVVNHKTRYYSIEINPTLFGEILLTREYGGVHNKKSTGVIKEYFSDLEDSFRVFESLINLKKRRGYYC